MEQRIEAGHSEGTRGDQRTRWIKSVPEKLKARLRVDSAFTTTPAEDCIDSMEAVDVKDGHLLLLQRCFARLLVVTEVQLIIEIIQTRSSPVATIPFLLEL